jgi:TatD DNase family protein
MFFDIHCHLSSFSYSELQKILESCKNSNISELYANSTDLESMERTLEIAEKFSEVKPCLGIYPETIATSEEHELERTFSFMKKNFSKAYALGECGLDFRGENANSKETQIEWLEKQRNLAESYGKPMILHSRYAEKQVLEFALDTRTNCLLHWFTNSKKLAKKATENKVFVSIPPTLLYHPEIESTVKAINPEFLLTETDSPFLLSGKQVTPIMILPLAKKIAEVLGISLKDLETMLENNKRAFFSNKVKKS